MPLSAPTLRVVETLRRAGLERPRVGATGDSIWQYNEQQSSVLKNWCRKITRCIVFDFFVHHIEITNNIVIHVLNPQTVSTYVSHCCRAAQSSVTHFKKNLIHHARNIVAKS